MRTLKSVSIFMLSLMLGTAAMAGRMPSNALVLSDTRASSAQTRLATYRQRVQRQAQSVENLRQYLVRQRVYSSRVVMPRFDTFVVTGTVARSARPRGRADTALTPVSSP